MSATFWTKSYEGRRSFIGGSDARIIMGDDEAALQRLWREKRGEAEPEDLSGNLHRPARARDRTPEPAVVRAHDRASGQRCPKLGAPPGDPLDGGDAGRHGRRHRRSVRSEIHAAVVVLGGGSGGEAHGPAPAQHVGHQCHRRGALDYHRRRQVGRDQDTSRFALSAPSFDGGKEILALRRERRAPSRLRRRATASLASRRCGSSI